MSEFLDVVSPKAYEDLAKLNTLLAETIKNVKVVNENMIGSRTPSGSDSAVKALNESYKQQEKTIQSLQLKLEAFSKKQQAENEKTRLSEIKLQQAREKAFDSYQRQSNRELEQVKKISGLYNQTQIAVNQLSQVYNDLAIKKALNGKLSSKEEVQLSKLSAELNIYQSALKKVDADIQKNGRNVGNYASHWNGLGNSINQLTREAPAFAVSLNTGFLALSNNLPILFDEINKVTKANKDLVSQGQPVKGVFTQLAGAILSWQTALSVGVLLLTLYGGKLIDSISGSEKKKKALEAEKKAIEDKVEAEKQQNETIGQSIAQEKNRARILFEIAKNEEVSSTKRSEALKELRSRYGKYLKDLSDQQILAGETAKAEEKLNLALIGRGYALATQNLLEKNATDQMSAQVEYQKTLAKSYKEIDKLRNSDGSIKNINTYNKVLRESNIENGKSLNALNKKLKPLKEEEELLLGLFKNNAKYLDSVNELGDKKKKVAKEDEQYQTNSEEAFKANISALEKTLSTIDRFSPAYDTINGALILQKKLYEQLFGTIKQGQEEVQKGIELTDEEIYTEYFAWLKLKEATDSYIKTLSSDAFNKAFENIGLDSAKMFLDFDENGKSTFDKLLEGADSLKEKFAVTFQSVGDLAQDVFNKMTQLSQQNLEQQLSNLEQEKDVALKFAGESTEARQEIEEQYNSRKRQLQRQQAEQQKKLAVFNILINTAQGVVSALASTPPNVPLSIAIGVIGALQAGIVAGQQIPAFEKGTDNAPEGWALTQEKGAEIITDRNRKVKSLGSNKGAKYTYLNKGDKVFTAQDSEALMFNRDFNALMSSNNIGMPIVNVNNDNSAVVSELQSLRETINGKPTLIINQDERGRRVYERKQAQTKEILNGHLTYRGYDV